MITVSIFVYFFIYIGGMFRSICLSIKDLLSNDESTLIKKLTVLLEDCLLRYFDILSD